MIKVWDIEAGLLLRTIHEKEAVRWAVPTQLGDRLLAGIGEHVAYFYEGKRLVRAYDLTTGKVINSLNGNLALVATVDCDPQGRLAVFGADNGGLRFWQLDSGHVEDSETVHSGEVRLVRVIANGRYALSVARTDHSPALWDLETRKCISRLEGHSGDVLAIDVIEEEGLVLTASGDQTVKVWSLTSLLASEQADVIERHRGPVNAIAATRDSHLVVSAAADKVVKVWEQASGKLVSSLAGHSNCVNTVATTPDSRLAISGDADGKVMAWPLSQIEIQGRLLVDLTSAVNALVVTPDGSQAVAGLARSSYSKQASCLVVVDIDSGRYRSCGEFSNHVNSLAVTSDGQFVVIGLDFSHWEPDPLQVWNLRKGKVQVSLQGHTGPVNAVAVTRDGRYVISGSADRTMRIWELASGKICCRCECRDDIKAVATTLDDRFALSGTIGGVLNVWAIPSGREVARFVFDGHVGDLAAFGDGRIVVGDGIGHVAFLQLTGISSVRDS